MDNSTPMNTNLSTNTDNKLSTSGDEQKFLICEFCRNFSAMSKRIPTCEHCTAAIVESTLRFVNTPKPNQIESCAGCLKMIYSMQMYLCDCKLKKYCFRCYTGTIWCITCNKLKSGNSIWAPGGKK